MAVTGLKDTINWYNENSEAYAQAGASYFDMNHIKTFRNLLPEGAHVLEAGCGSGRDARKLQDEGLVVTGLDLSSGLLDVARKNNPDIEFIEGNLLKLPFANDVYDGVWSNTSLLHLETVDDVKTALGEMARVLKHDGKLHVVVKSQTTDKKTAIVADKLSGHDRFFQYFKVNELISLLKSAGFTVLQSKEYSEIETIPHGRPEVMLIWCIAAKA